jgi:protein phosphatase
MANREIRELSTKNGSTIGSTLAALLAFERSYACMWAGDSRIYMLHGGKLSQLSRDHTEMQDLLDRGLLTREEAVSWPRRNVITRAIGAVDEPELDIKHGRINPGDKFLICSDGLTAHVSDDEIGDALAGNAPEEACGSLIELALKRGGSDNVTVVIVEFREAVQPSKDLWAN